jgi:hypothetical protein
MCLVIVVIVVFYLDCIKDGRFPVFGNRLKLRGLLMCALFDIFYILQIRELQVSGEKFDVSRNCNDVTNTIDIRQFALFETCPALVGFFDCIICEIHSMFSERQG